MGVDDSFKEEYIEQEEKRTTVQIKKPGVRTQDGKLRSSDMEGMGGECRDRNGAFIERECFAMGGLLKRTDVHRCKRAAD